MKLSMRVVAGIGLVLATSLGALAEGDAAGAPVEGAKVQKQKAEKIPVVLQDIKVEGVVAKTEKQTKDGKTIAIYELTTADGAKVILPAAMVKKDAPAAYNLEDFVGATAVVTGKGIQKQNDKGKTVTKLAKIVGIEKAVAPAGQ